MIPIVIFLIIANLQANYATPDFAIERSACTKFSCYYLPKDKSLKLKEAQRFCKNHNLRLAQIETHQLDVYLKKSLLWGISDAVYIDGCKTSGNKFIFENRAQMKYLNFASTPRSNCILKSSKQISWLSTSCHSRAGFICEELKKKMVDKAYCREGKCYHFSLVRNYYLFAKRDCEARGMALASIDSDDQMHFISDSIKKYHPGEFWISSEKVGDKVYSDWRHDEKKGAKILYRQWDQGQPNNLRGREWQLEVNYITPKHINDVTGDKINHYVCEENIDILKTSKKCLNNKCYYISNLRTTYNFASSICKLNGMKLARIINKYEKEALNNFLRSIALLEYYIEGRFVKSARTWLTPEKEELKYFNWRTEAISPLAHCISLNPYDEKWDKVLCNQLLPFLCEGPAN